MKKPAVEGDLYKTLSAFGTSFPLYYGYYDEADRRGRYCDPMPIYPDFLKQPQYTDDGYPFITQMQDACSFYTGGEGQQECGDCRHYLQGDELIGICVCEANRCTDRRRLHTIKQEEAALCREGGNL